MTSEAAGRSHSGAPPASTSSAVVVVAPHRLRIRDGDLLAMETDSSPKSAFTRGRDCPTDVRSFDSPGGAAPSGPTGKPPGGKSKKLGIQRSASFGAINSSYLSGDLLSPSHQSVIKHHPSLRVGNSPVSSRHPPPPPCSPKSASPSSLARSHLNLWPLSSLFKKMNLRSSFKKLCQGSTEGLNQELEKLTLTSGDAQRLQNVPDGHRAPVQELLDMFCDSPPTASSSAASDGSSATPSHLPLLPTLSSSSSSPPPAIASGVAEASSNPRHQQLNHQHHQHRRHHPHVQTCPHWSTPSGSLEGTSAFSLGSEVKQVKPLRSTTLGCHVEGCQEMMTQFKLRDERSSSRYQNVPSPNLSSSSLLSCSVPPGPLLSPVAIRANIPSNESAFASYPTLPKSFKVKDSMCHSRRGLEGLTGVGNS